MQEQDAQKLIKKYLAGRCSEKERALLEAWYISQNGEGLPEISPEAEAQGMAEVWSRLPIPQNQRPRPLWPRIAAAASILLALSFGAYKVFHKAPSSATAHNQRPDIAPGGNLAILTLSGGKKITLNGTANGKVASQGNTQINKIINGVVQYASNNTDPATTLYNTLATPRKGRYEVELSDGTVAILDAASSITYPVVFTGTERKVNITGQVYFKVKHDAAHPFVVAFDDKTVEDIGTEFNINAYTDEPAEKITLVSGSIKVNQQVLATSGQQAVLSGSSLAIHTVDPESVTAWKDNYFYFDGNNLEEVLRQVSRWYDVDIVYENEAAKSRSLSGTISRYKTVSSVLRKLSYTSGTQFRLEGHKLMVLKDNELTR